MASLARRVANSSLCGMYPHQNGQSSGSNSVPYPTRMEKVKFGVPLENVCGVHNDIPGPLLVMILRLNKVAPNKKDVFRAPGHQASMKKLIYYLQNGRLVNIDNYSVHTIASVLKKFLRKLPNGIFGPEREQRLFEVIEWPEVEEKQKEIHRILLSLPLVTQHLLVILFGTFRSIANSSETNSTGMSSEAISISVAPSFFQSCVSDGAKFARIEDVQRFKTASAIMKFMIDNFGVFNLFGRDNYEYYARITGRVLKVEENWIFAFKYPPENIVPRKTSLKAEREWLNCETQKWSLPPMGLSRQLKETHSTEECHSTPTLCSRNEQQQQSASYYRSQQHNNGTGAGGGNSSHIEDCYARLSMSLEENFFKFSTPNSNPNSPQSIVTVMHEDNDDPYKQQSYSNILHTEMLKLEDLKSVNHYAESTKSLTFLPIVHERQTQRMKTRSEWFLNPKENSGNLTPLAASNRSQPITNAKALIRKSSKDKRLIRRVSSKKDKENGSEAHLISKCEPKNSFSLPVIKKVSDSDCTESDVRQMNITFTYKPRI